MSLFNKPKFKRGEWVIIIDHTMEGFGGYIDGYDPMENQYFIEMTSTPSGIKTKGHFWVKENQLLSDEEIDLDEVQIACLLDIALDTKDFEWFKELSEQLNLSTRV